MRRSDMNRYYLQAESEPAVPLVVVLKVSRNFMINYSYLVIDPADGQAVIIDPAWEMEKIELALAENGAALKGILITHAHPDHIHLAEPLAAKHNCPIWMSHEGIAASGFSAGRLVGIDVSPRFVGNSLIQPILTPGHTPGGMCYLIGDNLFTGDTLFSEGCGMCPDIEAAHALFASLQQLIARVEPHVRVFPGHTYGKPLGQKFSQLFRENIYLNFKDRATFAAYRLRRGQDYRKMLTFT